MMSVAIVHKKGTLVVHHDGIAGESCGAVRSFLVVILALHSSANSSYWQWGLGRVEWAPV
eukprot:5345059-Amphidinium_carterae.1